MIVPTTHNYVLFKVMGEVHNISFFRRFSTRIYMICTLIIIIICLFRTRGTQYISKDAAEQPGATK